MHAAVCFYGMNRSLSLTFPSIKSSVFDSLRNAGVSFDVYAALMYPKNGFSNPRSKESDCKAEVDSVRLLEAVDTVFIDQEDFDQKVDYDGYQLTEERDQYKDGHASSRNIFRALFSLKYSYALSRRVNRAYDFFVFVRPDLLYHDVNNFEHYAPLVAKEPRKIFTPSWGQWGGLNDRMAVCGSYAAQIYANRFDLIRSFLEKTGGPLNPELLLLFAVIAGKLSYEEYMGERTSRIRSNNTYIREAYIEGQISVDAIKKYIELTM